jgi:hypothetical protein
MDVRRMEWKVIADRCRKIGIARQGMVSPTEVDCLSERFLEFLCRMAEYRKGFLQMIEQQWHSQ